jgi:hypothetical protein
MESSGKACGGVWVRGHSFPNAICFPFGSVGFGGVAVIRSEEPPAATCHVEAPSRLLGGLNKDGCKKVRGRLKNRSAGFCDAVAYPFRFDPLLRSAASIR